MCRGEQYYEQRQCGLPPTDHLKSMYLLLHHLNVNSSRPLAPFIPIIMYSYTQPTNQSYSRLSIFAVCERARNI